MRRPRGTRVIRDIVMDKTRTRPVSGALFAVNMLSATATGGTFTFDELTEDLAATGFTDVRFLRHGEGMDSLVTARKKAMIKRKG